MRRMIWLLPVGVVEDDDGQILGFRGLVPTETLFRLGRILAGGWLGKVRV